MLIRHSPTTDYSQIPQIKRFFLPSFCGAPFFSFIFYLFSFPPFFFLYSLHISLFTNFRVRVSYDCVLNKSSISSWIISLCRVQFCNVHIERESYREIISTFSGFSFSFTSPFAGISSGSFTSKFSVFLRFNFRFDVEMRSIQCRFFLLLILYLSRF